MAVSEIHSSTVHRASLLPFLITLAPASPNTRLSRPEYQPPLSPTQHRQLLKQTPRNSQTTCSQHLSPQRLCSCQHSTWSMVRHLPTAILQRNVCHLHHSACNSNIVQHALLTPDMEMALLCSPTSQRDHPMTGPWLMAPRYPTAAAEPSSRLSQPLMLPPSAAQSTSSSAKSTSS